MYQPTDGHSQFLWIAFHAIVILRRQKCCHHLDFCSINFQLAHFCACLLIYPLYSLLCPSVPWLVGSLIGIFELTAPDQMSQWPSLSLSLPTHMRLRKMCIWPCFWSHATRLRKLIFGQSIRPVHSAFLPSSRICPLKPSDISISITFLWPLLFLVSRIEKLKPFLFIISVKRTPVSVIAIYL